MKPSELLESLLTLFGENIPQADFVKAWKGKADTHRFTRPVVTGEIEGETVKAGSEEVKFKFRIYLPLDCGADMAEDIFAAMCTLAGEAYPGFSAISRGAADREKATGLLCVGCSLSFLTQTSLTPGVLTTTVTVGGKEYQVTGVKTAFGASGKELVAIGETEPFAVLQEKTEYTVELEGIETAGLDRLTGFTVSIGPEPATVYEGCRWKTLSDALRKAVFVSSKRS